ncbi:MAG TPA: hypothetical protein VKT49_11355, partial [Bryobacteraceae bacterium]|nr:hypothetical protein [Bryobacteraceae bacterium]
VAIDAGDPRKIYAATSSTLSQTQDGGQSWSRSDDGLLNRPAQELSAIIPLLVGQSLQGVAVGQGDSSTLYALTTSFVYSSSNNGQAWTRINYDFGRTSGPNQSPAGFPTALAVASNVIYVGIAVNTPIGSVFRSADGGSTWTPAGSGLQLSIKSLAVYPGDSNIVYAVAESGGDTVFKTTDGGASWLPLSAGLPSRALFGSIVIDPTSPDTAYLPVLTGSGGIYKTTDGGLTWNMILPGLTVNVMAVDPSAPAILYASTSAGLKRSTDAGATWLSAKVGLSDSVVSLAVDPTSPATVYAGTRTMGLFKTTNRGLRWQPTGSR